MCRIVIAIFFITFVSCVLAEAPHSKKNATEKCYNKPEVNDSKINLLICFNSTVARHLEPSIASKPGECQNVPDFAAKLNSHFNTMKRVCNLTSTLADATDFIKLVDFSLRNESFKKFYADVSCVKNLEANISNTCVKNFVGFFNITKDRKHTTWISKGNLNYNSGTCGKSKSVKNCVEVLLTTCQYDTREYVASLFKYARELADCTNLEKKAAIPSPNGNGTASASTLMTTPVIATVSIGSVVVAAAIIIIIVIKCKK